MMKILLVNKFLTPRGGSETYLFSLGKALTEAGNDVEYFGMEEKGRIVGNEADSYVSNLDFHSGGIAKIFYPFKIIYSLEAKVKIRKVLDKFQPEVVHLNNFNFQLTPSIIYEIQQYSREKNKKINIFYTAHDYQLICPNHMLRNGNKSNCEKCITGGYLNCIKHRCIHESVIRSAMGALEGYVYKRLNPYQYIHTIICPSYFMEKQLKKDSRFADKTKVIHNFIDIYHPPYAKKEPFILYFGRYSEEKGIRNLLNVCKKNPDIHFCFAGSGPLEDEVNKIPNVNNLGFLAKDELNKLIGKAIFTVFPSEWYENCPYSVMESIALGTPVLAADIGGIKELIEPGRTGELFENGNVVELERKLCNMWKNKTHCIKYADFCKEKKFNTAKTYINELLKIYKE